VTRYTRPQTRIISNAEYMALAELRYLIRKFLRSSEEAARAAGIEPQQHQLLLVLKRLSILDARPAISVLAERLQVRHHSAVELIDRSMKRGLVRRTQHLGDRRQVLVELTPKGERLLRDLTLHHRDAISLAAPALRDALNILMPKTSRKRAARPGGVKAPRKTSAAVSRRQSKKLPP
jgi:DNA-binding MarR family transcriptional regulator